MNKVYNYFTLPLTGITMLFWVVIPAIASPASAQTNEGLEPNPLAEQWILEKVARGEVADLEDMYPNETERVISVKFLDELVEGKLVQVPRQGVKIEHAVFVEPIDLVNAEIEYEISLEDCQFKETLTLSKSHLYKDLSLSGGISPRM